MKILIISKEAWRDEQNGGNVLTNMFAPFTNAEFAQIYCNEQLPNNAICKQYYQMTDKMMLRSIIRRTHVGRRLQYDLAPIATQSVEESYKSAATRLGGDFKRVVREIVWKLGRWDKKEILGFSKNFDPDVIFAPCYGNHYMLNLTRLIADEIKKPVISYISDDSYSYNTLKRSPLYYINHWILRRNLYKTFPYYSLVYTMTDEQKELCERVYGANMKILRKSGEFRRDKEKASVGNPIRFVYAGGTYINRWVTLKALADAMRRVNGLEKKIVLDIYTNTPIPDEAMVSLNDGITSNVHPSVSMQKLREIYQKSDIALHCEAFDKASEQTVRLSFSTKIVDCLDSGCAVMAICDSKQAGGAYLRRNNCAICVNDLKNLETTLRNIADNPQVLIDYQRRAFEVGRKNHLQQDITAEIIRDFQNLIQE